jgi:hypothetical protein
MRQSFLEAKVNFLRASQRRFTDWGEANNHRRIGAAIEEFYDLFVVSSSYYQRVRWIHGAKPVWYRQAQLSADSCDRWLGQTPYGKMFCMFARLGYKPLPDGGWEKGAAESKV